MKRIYLDQLHWIALSRSLHGRSKDSQIAEVCELLLNAREKGELIAPLSLAHYVETMRRRDADSRFRLGELMERLSGFETIRPLHSLITIEMHAGLVSRHGIPNAPQPPIFGEGFGFASDTERRPYFGDAEYERVAIERVGLEFLTRAMELLALTGRWIGWPEGSGAPSAVKDHQLRDHGFGLEAQKISNRNVDALQQVGHTKNLAHAAVLDQPIGWCRNLLPVLMEAIDQDPSVLDLSDPALREFVLSMPALGTYCRMQMSAYEDPNYRWKRGDFEDLGALAPAAAYCDIVATERMWGSMLNRHRDTLRATVITKLVDLPALLGQ